MSEDAFHSPQLLHQGHRGNIGKVDSTNITNWVPCMCMYGYRGWLVYVDVWLSESVEGVLNSC